MDEHRARVAPILSRIRNFQKMKTPFRIYHGSTLSTRKSSKRRSKIIDTSKLENVIDIDILKKTAIVEPNVPMDKLVAATMAKGLLPPIVMELPGITVGGGFAGTSGESSSFRYGLFDCTINSIEIVLSDGSIIQASPTDPETSDLFFGAAGSCGTLGVITLLEIQLIDAKPFVELEYIPVTSVEEAVFTLRELEKNEQIDYIDGILFTPTKGVIMSGRLTASPIQERHPQRFEKASDPWFYLHAESILDRTLATSRQSAVAKLDAISNYKESIPTPAYLFRYDRGAFWSGTFAFTYFAMPFNALTRYLLDPFMHTRIMSHAMHRSGLASQAVLQDLAIPYPGVEEFVSFLDSRVGLWPLWLCPVRSNVRKQKSFSLGKRENEDVFLDVGVWGMGPKDPKRFLALNREIEAKVHALGGIKCLYAQAYYTEDEFWDVHDRAEYERLRKKWRAEGLPSVYEKVKVDFADWSHEAEDWQMWGRRKFWGIWPLKGVYGVLSAVKGLMFGGDYLLGKS